MRAVAAQRRMQAGPQDRKPARSAAGRKSLQERLTKQLSSENSRRALRMMVQERLSRNIIDDMKTEEFESNPLADSEGEDEEGADASSTHAKRAPEGLDDLVRRRAHIRAHDPADDGLDETEFVGVVGGIWQDKSSLELTRLFMQIDTNSDGVVTFAAFSGFLGARTCRICKLLRTAWLSFTW